MTAAHWDVYRDRGERRCEWCRHAEGSPLPREQRVRCRKLIPGGVVLVDRSDRCGLYERAPGADDNRGA